MVKDSVTKSGDPLQTDRWMGRMNDPTTSAFVKGLCGDEMEFYLVIKNERIETVRYYSSGCSNTQSCGRAVASRTEGLTVDEALAISPADLINAGECLPEEGRHCAILAVTTFFRAIADYMLAY